MLPFFFDSSQAAMGVLEVFFPTLLSWSEEEIGWNSFASNILTLVVLGAAWYLRSIHSSLSSASFFFISISGILALSSAIVHSQLLLTCSLFFMTSCGYPSATITLIEKSFDASPNTSVQAVMARLGLFEILGILSRWATPWCLQYFQCSPSYQLVAYASLVFLYCISRLHDASSF